MKTLIIPDIHNRIERADHWLQTQRYDRVVFLGDYFDSLDDDVIDARRTALWLRQRIEGYPNDVFLLGNHDASYWLPQKDELYCPGFTKPKAAAINEILRSKHWDRFQLAHEEQGWLLSHAGFHVVWMNNPTTSTIIHRCDKAMSLARRGKVDPILAFGEQPGGLQRFGGPLWMDWESFQPIPGINQIVGHTSDDHVREKSGVHSINYCLDTREVLAAATLANGELNVHSKS